MNLTNRIIDNAVENFRNTPVEAPSYHDFTIDDDLIQYSNEETKDIFGIGLVFPVMCIGDTHVHYRWVDYCGTLELMSFTEEECLWRFGITSFKSLICIVYYIGSIDPSKEPTDIVHLDGVIPNDPSTYNDTFFIQDENNVCVIIQKIFE